MHSIKSLFGIMEKNYLSPDPKISIFLTIMRKRTSMTSTIMKGSKFINILNQFRSINKEIKCMLVCMLLVVVKTVRRGFYVTPTMVKNGLIILQEHLQN
jgi:hypothetical protein